MARNFLKFIGGLKKAKYLYKIFDFELKRKDRPKITKFLRLLKRLYYLKYILVYCK